MTLFQRKTRVLFVCTENICRSPLAEGLLRHHLRLAGKASGVKVSSAGTRTSQPGARPDLRAQKLAAASGINLGRISARRVTQKELALSDMIIAMDRANRRDLIKICSPEHQHKISLLLSHVPDQALEDVPDPYYGSFKGFEEVFHLLEDAVFHLVSAGGLVD